MLKRGAPVSTFEVGHEISRLLNLCILNFSVFCSRASVHRVIFCVLNSRLRQQTKRLPPFPAPPDNSTATLNAPLACRPNVLYMADAGTRESQQAELVKMCIEGDKVRCKAHSYNTKGVKTQ